MLTSLSKMIAIPVYGMFTLYHPGGEVLQTVKCHPRMAAPLEASLQCLKTRLPDGYKLTYHGCYNYRNIANTNKLSRHATGEAIDLNAGREMKEEWAECFEKNGFIWGGRWKVPGPDPMHFELRRKQ